jgi:hypothetical protein
MINQYDQHTGQNTARIDYNPTSGAETEKDFFNGGAHAYEEQFFNGGAYASEIEMSSSVTGAATQVDYFNSSNGVITTRDWYNGGAYAYEVDHFNASGVQIAVDVYNPTSGGFIGYGTDNTPTMLDDSQLGDAAIGSDELMPTVSGGWSVSYGGITVDWGGTYTDDYWDPVFDIPAAYFCDDEDPVILNLQDGPVTTVGASDSRAQFDIDNTGTPVQTGWATAGEAMLVYDQNGSGSVTRGADLVGGFDEMTALDTNHDGRLDASDSTWNSLKAWVDATGTAQFDSSSLISLDKLGVVSINLGAQRVNRDSNGNTIVDVSTFAWADGSTGDIAGVGLATINQQVSALVSAMAGFNAGSTASVGVVPVQAPGYASPLLATGH